MKQITECYNTIDYDCNIKELHQKSKELQKQIKKERKNFEQSILDIANLFPYSEVEYKSTNSNKITFSYYYQEKIHYFDLIYIFEEDFHKGYFYLKTIEEPSIENINEYQHVLNIIQKQLENKFHLLNKLENFAKEQNARINLITQIQQNIYELKLAVHLCHKKDEFRLNEIKEIFPLNNNFQVTDLINLFPEEQESIFYNIFTYKFNFKHFELHKHYIKIITREDKSKIYFINENLSTLEEVNAFLKYSFSYNKTIVDNIKILKKISPSVFDIEHSLIKLPYQALLTGLKLDLNMLKFKNF